MKKKILLIVFVSFCASSVFATEIDHRIKSTVQGTPGQCAIDLSMKLLKIAGWVPEVEPTLSKNHGRPLMYATTTQEKKVRSYYEDEKKVATLTSYKFLINGKFIYHPNLVLPEDQDFKPMRFAMCGDKIVDENTHVDLSNDSYIFVEYSTNEQNHVQTTTCNLPNLETEAEIFAARYMANGCTLRKQEKYSFNTSPPPTNTILDLHKSYTGE